MKMYLKDTNEEVIADIVCMFETEDEVKYIVLTNSKKEQGLYNIEAFYYENANDKLLLTPVKEEDNYLVIEALNMLKEENK